MKKNSPTTQDPWNETTETPEEEVEVSMAPTFEEPEAAIPPQAPQIPDKLEYSLEGLKSDFATAKELEQFVFDETGVSLKIRGIDPELRFKIALNVLNDQEVDPKYITGSNPYVDNKDLIPEDPLKPIPRRDPRLPAEEPMTVFHDMSVPHPDRDLRAVDAKVNCMFRTYADGSISYEILGPLEKHAHGEKLDKYGRSRPEKFIWIDPRTGEQGLRYADGSYSVMGKRLRTLMESKKVNRNQSVWSVWIDRSFTAFNQSAVDNPWLE